VCAVGTIETLLMSMGAKRWFGNFQAYGAGVIDFAIFFC
jgi:hypothetical protein